MMRRRQFFRSVAAGAVVAGSAMVIGSRGSLAPQASVARDPLGASAPSGFHWSPYFDDQFTTIDTNRWFRYHNTYGDGFNALDHHRPENLVADGTLKIITRREAYRGREITSGFLSTGVRGAHAEPAPAADTFFPRTGYYECRAKIQHAQGLIQAFWLRHRAGANVADISIMEQYHAQTPGHTEQILNLDGGKNTFKRVSFLEDPTQPADWHVWGLAITPEGDGARFRFYLDGTPTGSYLARDAKFWTEHPDELLWDISINTHTGGDFAGHPDDDPVGRLHNIGRCSIGYDTDGYPDSCPTTSPEGHPIIRWESGDAVFEVDYVRVWSLAPDW